jgi:hypothetical protein
MLGTLYVSRDPIWLDGDVKVVPVDYPVFSVIHNKDDAASQGEHYLAWGKWGEVSLPGVDT